MDQLTDRKGTAMTTTYPRMLRVGDDFLTSHDFDAIDEAIAACDLAATKGRANDAAFAERFDSNSPRSRRSRAASARNRAQAFENAAGDADRLVYGLNRSITNPYFENASTFYHEEMAAWLRFRRDYLLAAGSDLSGLLD